MKKAKLPLADFHLPARRTCTLCKLPKDLLAQINAHYKTNGGEHAKVRRWLKQEHQIEVTTTMCYGHYTHEHYKEEAE